MIPIRHTTPASDVTSPNCRKAPSRAVSRLPVAMTANPATTAPVSPSRRPAADPAPSPVPPLDTEGSQKSETCRPGEPGYAREATFREPRRAPAASSAGQPRSSVSLPCAVAQSPAWTAFRPPPVCCARRGRAAGLDHQPAGGRTQAARASALRCMPGARAHLVFGACVASLGRNLGRTSPLPGICGRWCSAIPFCEP